VQCGIGPATDEGFFYDFIVERPFVPDDLAVIEKKMKELAADDLPYERQMWPRDEAKAFFAQRGELLKVQLIDEKTAGQQEVSCYTIKDPETFIDFCVGPHVPSTGRLKAFKLLSTSNAYWKGDARNQPMQRIYGTADKDLKAYSRRFEAKGATTGSSGASLDCSSSITGHLARVRLTRARRSTRRWPPTCEVLLPAGYVEVKTPLVFNKALWEKSGHWSTENMFLIESEGDTMSVKPMNCPGHFAYASEVQLPRLPSGSTSRRRFTATSVGVRRDSRVSASSRRTTRTAS
jgi:threonyl-tRNA synthetase